MAVAIETPKSEGKQDAHTTKEAVGVNKAEVPSDETEKQRADRLHQEFVDENPSNLKTETEPTAVDLLRKDGVAIPEIYTAPLPGGGPSTVPGMSAGGPVPNKEEVQKQVDKDSEELKKKQEKERQEKEKARQEKEKKRAEAQTPKPQPTEKK